MWDYFHNWKIRLARFIFHIMTKTYREFQTNKGILYRYELVLWYKIQVALGSRFLSKYDTCFHHFTIIEARGLDKGAYSCIYSRNILEYSHFFKSKLKFTPICKKLGVYIVFIIGCIHRIQYWIYRIQWTLHGVR